MSSSADAQKAFLLNVRALVYKRLALCPVGDSTNPNHGFDFNHAYFELHGHRDVTEINEEAPFHDGTKIVGANQGCSIGAEGVGQCSPPITSRAKTLAKRPPEENPALDLTLSPENSDSQQLSKRGTRASSGPVHRIRGAAGNADQAANIRGARTRNKPPAQLLTRLNRALAHPLYLVERQKDGHSFAIVGASGAVYSVQIAEVPKCNCPDFVKRAGGQRSSFAGPCKHILFVMHRVLKVDQFDSALYQVRLTQVELERIFRASPEDPCSTLLADDALVRKFRESQDIEHRSNGRGGECPICMDILREGDKGVSVCSVCENCIHTDCMRMYLRLAWAGQNAHCAGQSGRRKLNMKALLISQSTVASIRSCLLTHNCTQRHTSLSADRQGEESRTSKTLRQHEGRLADSSGIWPVANGI
jgi:SWIM zinc finger